MQRKQEKTEDVERGDVDVLKAVNHHRVDVVMTERVRFEQSKPSISHAHSEMGEVIDDEREHDQPAHEHVARCERSFHIRVIDVRLGPGAAIVYCQPDRDINVNDHGDEQEDAHDPEQRSKIA